MVLKEDLVFAGCAFDYLIALTFFLMASKTDVSQSNAI
jgi:hypothetical protein